MYQRLLEVVIEELYGLCAASNRKKVVAPGEGIFGTMRAHYAVTEAQARGTLHWHQLVFINTSPDLLERALRNKHLQSKITHLISSFIETNVPANLVQEIQIPQAVGTRSAFQSISTGEEWLARDGIALPSDDNFDSRVHNIACSSNSHDPLHKPTCAKGTSGKHGCRMCMRKPVVPFTGPVALQKDGNRVVAVPIDFRQFEDLGPFMKPSEVIVWDVAREPWSVYISPYNKDLANVCCCNTNVEHLGAPAQARAAIYYIAKYMNKDAFMVSTALASITEAISHSEHYASIASDAGTTKRKWCQTIQRWINNMSSRHEVSSQQAAATCLGHTTTTSSELFWVCYSQTAIRYLRSLYPDDFHPVRQYKGCLHEVAPSPFLDIQSVVEEILDFSDEEIEIETHEELVLDANNKAVTVGQHTHYFYSPPEVRHNVSLYEFTALFDVIKKTKVDTDDTELLDTSIPGRKANLRIDFTHRHPLFKTHCLRLRSKQRVPKIAGSIPFHPGNMPIRGSASHEVWLSKMTTWSRFCIITFLPWDDSLRQRLRDPVHAIDTWVTQTISTSSDINLPRYQAMFNTTVTLRQSHIDKTLCTSFRMRDTDQWKDFGVHAPRPPLQSRKIETSIDEALDFIRALASGAGTAVSQTSLRLTHTLAQVVTQAFVSNLQPPIPLLSSEQDTSLLRSAFLNDSHTGGVGEASSTPFEVFPLDVDQLSVYNLFAHWMRHGDTHSPLVCVMGGPGTGKSEISKTLLNDFGPQVTSTAYMGASASLLNGGTLCSTFHMTSFGNKGQSSVRLKGLHPDLLESEMRRWSGVKLLIIDEISQVTETHLLLVSARLKQFMGNQQAFGGLAVLLMGDMYQLPPVFGRPIYEGGATFDAFRLLLLQKQHRSDCLPHNANLQNIRNVSTSYPFAAVKWDVYKTLTRDDMVGDFSNAVHVCSTNEERCILNRVLAEQYARKHSKVLLRWKHALPAWASTLLSGSHLSTLITNRDDFYGLFVAGAPAALTQNFSTRHHICNGTICEMISVGYYDATNQLLCESAISTAVSTSTVLAEIPTPDFINVRLPNGAIFPVVLSDEIDLKLARKTMTVRTHACEIAFAVTFHKIQGRTLEFVILHLAKTSALRAQSVLVGMSRVRAAARMRLFPGDIAHISTKTWDPALRAFYKRLKT